MTVQQEDLSKYVFGSNHMLAVMVEIGRSPNGEFSTPQIASATGLPMSTTHSLITRLKRAGLVRRTGEVTPDRVALYERRSHSVWRTAQDIDSEAEALRAGTLTDLWEERS